MNRPIREPCVPGDSWKSLLLIRCQIVLFVLSLALSVFVFAGSAHADLANCDALRAKSPWQFLGPLVDCFTAPDPQMQPGDPWGTQYGPPPPATGLIPAATINFMNNMQAYFKVAASAMAVFMMSWFGLKLMAGDVQNVKGEAFTLLFKIAGVFFFLDEAPVIYNDLLSVMGALNTIIGNAITNANGGTVFCGQASLWQAFDCLMLILAGVAGVGLIAIIILVIATVGTGVVILFAFVYLVVTLFFTIARFAQIYLMSVVALSLMFSLGYIFVPFLFFKHTFEYFQKWLAICLAYVLIPVVMYGYMGMTFVAIDQSIISGQYSIMKQFFSLNDVSAMNPADVATGLQNSPAAKITCPTNSFDGKQKNYFDTGNKTGAGCVSTCTPRVYIGQDCVVNNPNTKTNVGFLGSGGDNGISGMQYRSWYCSSQNAGETCTNSADLSYLANSQGAGKTPVQWMFDILISILVAALLIYIMYSLLGYIPDLASELVSQGTSAARSVVKAEVFSEAGVKFAHEMAKEIAMAVATGGASAGESIARKGGEQLAKKAGEMAAEKVQEKADSAGGGDKKEGGGEGPYG